MKSDQKIYGGTVHRAKWIKHDLIPPYNVPNEGLWLSLYCAAVDLPLSVVGDLFTLPITVPASIERKWHLSDEHQEIGHAAEQEVFQAPYYIEEPVDVGTEWFPPNPNGYELVTPPEPAQSDDGGNQ